MHGVGKVHWDFPSRQARAYVLFTIISANEIALQEARACSKLIGKGQLVTQME